MVKRDNKGKETRAVVPVRADSGDSTCPTWLDREARKRIAHANVICTALINVGYIVCRASSNEMGRDSAQLLLEAFRNPQRRLDIGIHGLDILCVPVSSNTVKLEFLGVFKDGTLPPEIQLGIIKLHFKETIDLESFYESQASACNKLGPEVWIHAQINRLVDGKRQRDRVTYGLLYGKASESIVEQAAKQAIDSASESINKQIIGAIGNINDALALAKQASELGDLEATMLARNYARAYADATAKALGPEYLTVSAALRILARFDLHGLTHTPILESVHESLMASIYALPSPTVNTNSLDSVWICVEHVKVHSPADVAALAKWMRE